MTDLPAAVQEFKTTFGIGGVRVSITGERDTDARLLAPLDRFLRDDLEFEIGIQVRWVDEIKELGGEVRFDSGKIWRLYDAPEGFRFDFSSEMRGIRPYKRLLVDRKFTRATLLMSGECFSAHDDATDPLGYPLDELLVMHRLTQEPAIELHGVGMVGPDGMTNLFVGHSEAGKSTTARLWSSAHDVKILSDDRIIVREDVEPGKLRRECLPPKFSMYGTPWHGEACFSLPDSAPLHRIFVLEHGVGNRLTRLTKADAVGELFARSFVPFHRHEYLDHALSFLERLAGVVPCYRYSFEPDERAVERIIQFRD